MIGGGRYCFNSLSEPAILAASQVLIDKLMQCGLDIIVDETNMTKKSRHKLIEMIKQAVANPISSPARG
jgi:hypothetical protein